MKNIEEKILQLAHEADITQMSLREIGRKIGNVHPQTVKNSIIKLREQGLIQRSKEKGFIKEMKDIQGLEHLLYEIPILGSANCGNATLLAEENFCGFLRISNSILRKKNNLFALIASGDSMNNASIDGDPINDGDYVIVDADKTTPQNGDYVLSIIDGCANIKKFIKDKNSGIIRLVSESTYDYSPIFIHEKDAPYYFINGKVVKVIKNIVK